MSNMDTTKVIVENLLRDKFGSDWDVEVRCCLVLSLNFR